MVAAKILLTVAAAYIACGLLFGLVFIVWGVGRVDAAARGTPVGFRLLILPGVVAWWPLLLVRWLHALRAERGHS
jgi:hypothetical protein